MQIEKKNVNDPLTHPTFVFKKIDHVKDKQGQNFI